MRFHETIVGASANPFFIYTLRRINCVRRLLALRSMQDRTRYVQHCKQHLEILALLERGRKGDASQALRAHLVSALSNYGKIREILRAPE